MNHKNNMPEVAISLSGGGFRAAMFHLGTLSYLNYLRLPDGRPFLDIVNVMSTVSGGSITGLWYMMNFCKGLDTEESIRQLYAVLNDSDILKDSIDSLLAKGNTNKSLIKEVERVYDSLFFHGETFGLLQNGVDNTHIHHFSANGTDFSTGYGFRFQASRRIINAKPEFSRGFIGNGTNRIPWDVASGIRLSEILAVSSCFPGAFEPLAYPHDFSICTDEQYKYYTDEAMKKPIPLMDGGIVDNQGIEPILLANRQMALDLKTNAGENCIDLIIVSDVASTNIKSSHIPLPFNLPNITLYEVNCILNLVIVVLAVLGYCLYVWGKPLLLGGELVLLLDAVLLRLSTRWLKRIVAKCIKFFPFSSKWNRLMHLPFGTMQQMIGSRLDSLVTLAQAVFMKPIRQMRYKALYEDKGWTNRLISNNVTELSSKGTWKHKKNYLIPSEEMVKNSDLAASMGTSLWFSEKEKKDGMPEALFTAGQYNICMNLLEYVSRIESDTSNTTTAHQIIVGCKQQLTDDWKRFLLNPKWLFMSHRNQENL